MKTRGKVLVLGGLVVALAASGYVVRREYQRAAECDRIEAAVEAFGSKPVTTGSETVTVLGDSYALGWHLPAPREDSWATAMGRELDAEVRVDAVGGSGFTGSTYCDDTAFADRAGSLPAADVTIIQGGLNDTGHDGVSAAAAEVIGEVPGDVVVVGPPPAPQRDAGDLERVDASLAAAADEAGAEYVSTLGWGDLDYQADRLHLTPAGSEVFGERVAQAVQGS